VATQVFSDAELERLRGFPEIDGNELVRFFTLTPTDETLVRSHRGASNRLGVAVQPEPVVVTAALADQATVGVVEEEVSLELLPGRRPSEPPERCRLPVGEELHAHTQAQTGGGLLGLPFNPARLLLTPQHGPRGLVRADLESPLQALGGDPVLAGSEPPRRREPDGERCARLVEDRARGHRGAAAAAGAHDPAISEPPPSGTGATRALPPLGPAQPLDVVQAVLVRPEPRLELASGAWVVDAGTRAAHYPSILLRLNGYPQPPFTRIYIRAVEPSVVGNGDCGGACAPRSHTR
jgi:hypothetical protein